MCVPVVFPHLQCGLEPRNIDGTNLGSCCLQRTSRFGQRGLSLPYEWKSLLSVACLVFPFSTLKPILHTYSGHASLTPTQLCFLKVVGLSTLFLNYLANWYQESTSQVLWCACHAWFVLGALSLVFFSLFFLLLLDATHVIHPSSSQFEPRRWAFWVPCVFWRCPLSGAIEACVTWLCSHILSMGLNPETSMALT